MPNQDTIAAIATPAGTGGIGIVRVSGELSRKIAESITGCVPRTRYAEYVSFFDADGETLDQGLAIYFRAPASFTGEDVLELQGHGGPVVMDMLLERVIDLGARIARPGEFTERAFLNDKIDLSQAEAIADLINSQSRSAVKGAMRSLQGEFSRLIAQQNKSLVQLRLYVEASIDFPEEEVDFLSDSSIDKKLDNIIKDTEAIIQRAKNGALLREGIKIVLAGRPNAGKSSLMNRLSGRDSAIVTEIPGTTRDVLREDIDMDGFRFQLADTAGLRESSNIVEEEGVRRAYGEIEYADRILLLVDINDISNDRAEILEELRLITDKFDTENRLTLVLNKADLLNTSVEKLVPDSISSISVSALTGQGIDDLINHLKEVTLIDKMPEGNFTARRRHIHALEKTMDYLSMAKEQLSGTRSGELLADDLKMAQRTLSEITGEFTADDLLGEIFSSFCIGK